MIRVSTHPYDPGLPLSDDGISPETFVREAKSWYNRLRTAMQSDLARYRRNEKFLLLKDWEGVPAAHPNEPQPVTPVLFSTKENLLADINEARPTVEVTAQSAGYAQKAQRIAQVAKFYLDQRQFSRSFETASDNALVYGPFILEVFWDPTLRGGMGDINIQPCDARTFLADPGVEEINDSPCVIRVNAAQRSMLMALYPDKAQELTQCAQQNAREALPPGEEEMDKASVLDFWWREYHAPKDEPARFTVNFARICGDVLLEKKRDVYAHGRYPFCINSVFRVPGRLFGMSLYDVFADTQSVIDVLDQAVVKNALMASHPKKLVARRAGVDREGLSDMLCEVVEADSITPDALRWQESLPLPPQIPAILADKIDMLKDESGQNQFNRGEGGRGVTAASAIASLQEAGSKRSRLIISRIYEAVQDAAELLVALIAERIGPYDVFVITNDLGQSREVTLRADDFVLPDAQRLSYTVNVRVEKEAGRQSTVFNELMTQLIDSGRVMPEIGFAAMNIPNKQVLLNALADSAARRRTDPNDTHVEGENHEG